MCNKNENNKIRRVKKKKKTTALPDKFLKDISSQWEFFFSYSVWVDMCSSTMPTHLQYTFDTFLSLYLIILYVWHKYKYKERIAKKKKRIGKIQSMTTENCLKHAQSFYIYTGKHMCLCYSISFFFFNAYEIFMYLSFILIFQIKTRWRMCEATPYEQNIFSNIICFFGDFCWKGCFGNAAAWQYVCNEGDMKRHTHAYTNTCKYSTYIKSATKVSLLVILFK